MEGKNKKQALQIANAEGRIDRGKEDSFLRSLLVTVVVCPAKGSLTEGARSEVRGKWRGERYTEGAHLPG